MLELKEGCRALVPPNGDCGGVRYVYYRIISVVIAFLGPWRDFGVADGPHWNRGRPRLGAGIAWVITVGSRV